jgi:hypothetical protein
MKWIVGVEIVSRVGGGRWTAVSSREEAGWSGRKEVLTRGKYLAGDEGLGSNIPRGNLITSAWHRIGGRCYDSTTFTFTV